MRRRERLEDLGRLLVLLENIFNENIFDILDHTRCKDFVEYFESWKEEKKSDWLHDEIYGLSNLRDKISECVLICRAQDDLNDNWDESYGR